MPSDENRDIIDDLVENVVKPEPIMSYNSQSLSALSFVRDKNNEKRSRIKSNDDSLVINMVHSEVEEDEDEITKTDVTVKRNPKNSYQDSDVSTSSQSENLSSSLMMPVKQESQDYSSTLSRNEEKNNDYLNVLKYELKEKDLDIVQLQKEINELQLENKMLKAKIPLYSTQFDLLKDETAKTMDVNNPYIKEMLVFKREKDIAMDELMKAQDCISRLKLEKNCKNGDFFDPNSPELLKKKLKTYERQIRELEAENEKYSTELTKYEKNLSLLKQENADIRIKIGENKILYEREQGLLIDMADLKNELKKLKQANGQLLEVNKRLVEELSCRQEPTLAVQEGKTTSTQTPIDQIEVSKAKKPQLNNSDEDLNTTYCIQQNSDSKKISKQHISQTRSGYETNQSNYNLSRTDDNIINNFRPFNHSGFHSHHSHHASLSPKKYHNQVPPDYEYENHYSQTRNIDPYNPVNRLSRQSFSRYEEQHEYYKPDSSDSQSSNKIKETRSRSLRQYSSNETEEDEFEDRRKKSLKINVMRDIKSAQKLKLKRDEVSGYRNYQNEYRHKNIYEQQPKRESGLRRSMTFTSKSSKNIYEVDSDFNSTPSDSQINLYNPKYQDDDYEYISRTMPCRSKSVTAMERRFMESRDDEVNQRELMAKKRPFVPAKPDDIRIGDVIKFSRPGGKISKGMVKYIGPLPDRNDVYFGLELDSEEGKHDGIYNEKRYFQTKPNKGVFVSFSKVVMAWG